MQNESNFHPHTHIEYFNPDVTSLAKAYQDSSSALSHFHAGKYYDSFDDFIKKEAVQYQNSGDGVSYVVWNVFYDDTGQEEKREIVADNVFRQMCDTKTPQGILTVLKKPVWTVEDILKGEAPLVMVLEDLQDPGNAGTIFRTGEGAGVTGVFLTKTCVDITNPKVIRSTMGSVYRMPFLYVEDVVSLKAELEQKGIRTFAAHLKGKNSYDQENYQGGTAFLIGNEGNGLTEEAAEAADCLIRIPMCGKVESLNAAMAAGILMYEAARQRR